MDAVLKSEIQEIVELVKTLPESLQLRTLELLLQDLLDRTAARRRTRTDEERNEDPTDEQESVHKKQIGESEGLKPDTLPMRLKAFMKRTKVTSGQLESLFHIEGNQYEPIWTLTATQFSKAQVQIALLQSLQRALTSGEFSFNREDVRQECKKRHGYSRTNFNANFQNSGKLFSGLEKEGLVSLTDDGMTALASLISELAGADDGK